MSSSSPSSSPAADASFPEDDSTAVDASISGFAGVTTTPSSSPTNENSHDTVALLSGPLEMDALQGDSSSNPADSKSMDPKYIHNQCETAVLLQVKELISGIQSPNGIARINVPSGKSFLVHIDLLAAKSSYFRAALTGNFQEALTKELTLEDVSDTTISFFLRWIYTQNLGLAVTSDWNCESKCPLSWTGLFDIWLFADYTRTPELQNHVIDQLVRKTHRLDREYNREPFIVYIDDIHAAILMLWTGNKTTPQGEIAKPLRDLLLDFIGNPRFMSKAQFFNLRKRGLPAMFWCEFSIHSIDRSFDMRPKAQALYETISAVGNNVDNVDRDLEESRDISFNELMNLDLEIGEVLSVWSITPFKYYVNKEAKPGQIAKT
ncbi:Kelch repeat and BTB domain-containing protein 8 [Cytospora mali]|uniref:Kelch repeat and BTB domain-containing protein 8 n=1 Tax=Cytospora mali TaxID=578113 RepID=A0A194VSA6_CYTMA|nr:Kelch repeat and BTB domain-containing protein 8 [Valsa mali]